MFGGGLFIFTLGSDPQYFVIVVVTVISSIVLHELAHGYAAIKLGDDTPIRLERMTLNPVVHMGPISLIGLAIAGIAWGAMPINPSRLRGRYGGAIVAAAGPATNLLLAVVALTALGVMYAVVQDLDQGVVLRNAERLLRIYGETNLVLMVFNLLPVPPLDGSRILADFSRGYASFVDNPANMGVVLFMFPIAFLFSGRLFDLMGTVTNAYLTLFLPPGYTLG